MLFIYFFIILAQRYFHAPIFLTQLLPLLYVWNSSGCHGHGLATSAFLYSSGTDRVPKIQVEHICPSQQRKINLKKNLYIEYVKDHNVLLDYSFGYLQLYLLGEVIPLTLGVYLTDCTAMEGLNPQVF